MTTSCWYRFVRRGNIMTKVTRILGPLERQIMSVIWASDQCSVWDVVRKLPHQRAYTTVMTTLDRLYQKRILSRQHIGRKFLYSARQSPQQLQERVTRSVITSVLADSTNSRASTVSSLLKAIRQRESRLFDQTGRNHDASKVTENVGRTGADNVTRRGVCFQSFSLTLGGSQPSL